MKLGDWIVLGAVVAAFVIIRGTALLGPFVLPFETAFQEAIALSHLENGILENRLLPVIADLAGERFYHTAHPPLLHIIYALLYQVFGVHEAVTRIFSLVLFTGSVVLWRSLAGSTAPRGAVIIALAFLFPAAFVLCTTTNYELLSVFMISFIAWLVLRRRAGLAFLLPAVTLGMLVDWPVYLAVPALLILKRKEPFLRRRLLFLFGYEAGFFLLLQLYQYAVAGEAAVFSHARERANPAGLFSGELWSELGSHLSGVLGTPATVIASVGLAWCIGLLLQQHFWKERTEKHADEKEALPPAWQAFLFFLVFSILLLLSAFQLVCRHYVYLLYFVPPAVFGIYLALSSRGLQVIAIAAVLLVFAGRDIVLSNDRNPKYYGMATSELLPEIETAFSTSAVGAWKFYKDAETGHPVSAYMDQYLLDHRPQLLHLDLSHYEVKRYEEVPAKRGGEYIKVFSVPGERVYLREDVYQDGTVLDSRAYIVVENERGGTSYLEPVSVFIMAGEDDSPVNTAAGEVRAAYAVRQHPGPTGSLLSLSLPEGKETVAFQPALVHSFPFALSDGADFMAMVTYNSKKEGGNDHRLIYFRHLGDRGRPVAAPSAARLSGSGGTLELVTTPGPRLDYAFDDAYWLEPLTKGSGRGRPE